MAHLAHHRGTYPATYLSIRQENLRTMLQAWQCLFPLW